jgi:hypothetical protein
MTNKKDYKIFDRLLTINLESFTEYLEIKHLEILNNSLPEENSLTDILVRKYNYYSNAPTKLNQRYNIFKFDNKDIREIYKELKNCIEEACLYYGYDFEAMDYRVRGWFNHDSKTKSISHDPLKNSRLFHDHLGGHGAPDFHGYYCVNAEPSSTYYKINNETLHENKNLNNRLVVVENGHPHSRGDWNEDSFRITIAYDIVPLDRLIEQGVDQKTHWIKFE